MTKNSSYLVALTLLASLSTQLLADTSPPSMEDIPDGLVQLSPLANSRSAAWSGIGRLRGVRGAYCTASLIDTRNPDAPTENSPAYIITSQRCLNTDQHDNYAYFGGIQHTIPTQGKIHFNHFENTLSQTKTYDLKTITWQSDVGFNIAIIELKASLPDLIKAGIHPLKIAPATPATGTEILALGIPQNSNLYATNCTQLAPVDIASYPRVGIHLLPNRCADLTPGGRGGPILDKTSNELISLLVASNHGIKSRDHCLANSPCELQYGLPLWSPDTHYTLPVSYLNRCFNQGMFAAANPQCDLYELASVSIKGSDYPPARILQKLATDPAPEPDTYQVALSASTPGYRYKYTHTAQECHSRNNYSSVRNVKSDLLNIVLDNTVGMHLICILGINSDDEVLTEPQLKAGKIIAINRFAASPALMPDMQTSTMFLNDESYGALWKHSSPFFEHYETKFGDYSTTDCSDPKCYEPVMDMGFWLSHLLSSGEIDSNKYSNTDLSSPESRRLMGLLHGEKVTRNFEIKDKAIKLCTVVYNRENVRSEPRIDIFKPL